MENTNNNIGEATTAKRIKDFFALPGIIAACKTVRKVTIAAVVIALVAWGAVSAFGKEDPQAEFERLSKEQGALEYQQGVLSADADKFRSWIANNQKKWSELQTQIDPIIKRKDELRPSFIQAGDVQK